ncbi:MAG: MFS transporter [Candidatus Lokiarchaeota archaeon]|nr:MFS transporter [Candidatus Lokiarchaeota archaeon]
MAHYDTPEIQKHGFFTQFSFGMADLHLEMISSIFSQFLLLYWETEIGLNIWIYTAAYVVFVIWNMLNDPLIGFFADKPRKYWRRFGKRLPLILMGGLPFSLALPFVFNTPYWDVSTYQKWYYFVWLLISICFYDSFYSLISLNHEALYPAKFRIDQNRRSTSAVRMTLQIFGTLLGAGAPLLMEYQNRESYGRMTWWFAGIGFLVFLSYIPGHLESKELRMRYEDVKAVREKQSFFQVLKIMLKQRNFMAVVLIFFLDSIIGASLVASVHYAVEYGLELESNYATFVLLGFIGAALIFIPFWLVIAQKWKDNRKMLILGVFLNTIFLLPLAFFWDIWSLVAFAAVLGVGGAALRVSRHPVMADVIDESIAKTGQHLEGSFMGIYTFFNRFALIAQQIIFAVVHTLTGFNPDATSQSDLALFGIRLHTAIIPMVLCLIGLIVFIKLYDLTPERTKRVKEQIIELGL